MATTTKDSALSPSLAQAGTPAAQSGGTQASQRTDAIGIEIPVVVYASRYSATGRGLSKSPPPVREETRTVIVFAQGAVVRLSANISVGEMVVLTNQQTGADGLCRVGAVKTQPGIQNYVDLEFTQRAPGFWDASSAASPSVPARTERPAPEPVVRTVATVPAMPAPRQQPVAPPSPATESASQVAAAKPVIDYAATASPITPLAQESTRLSPARPIVPLASNPVPGASAGAHLAQPALSTLTGDRMDWTKQTPPASKKGLWAAIAAVAVAGILGGGFLLSRRGQSASPAAGITVAAPSAPQQPAASARADEPQAPVAAESAPAAAAVPVQPPTWLPETARHEQQQAQNVPPAAQAAQPTPRRAAIPVGNMAAPHAKTPVMVSSSEPPPVLLTQGNGAAEGILRTGELSAVSRAEAPTAFAAAGNSPAQPARPVTIGGRIEMPKLISSPDPQYPAAARAQSLDGVVVLDALVDAAGKVTDVKVVSGPMLLRQAAIDALRKWKYQPAQLNGQPTAVHTNVNIRFAIR
jgi:periplasmic protein TonB